MPLVWGGKRHTTHAFHTLVLGGDRRMWLRKSLNGTKANMSWVGSTFLTRAKPPHDWHSQARSRHSEKGTPRAHLLLCNLRLPVTVHIIPSIGHSRATNAHNFAHSRGHTNAQNNCALNLAHNLHITHLPKQKQHVTQTDGNDRTLGKPLTTYTMPYASSNNMHVTQSQILLCST